MGRGPLTAVADEDKILKKKAHMRYLLHPTLESNLTFGYKSLPWLGLMELI
jgi:hypothetical protein